MSGRKRRWVAVFGLGLGFAAAGAAPAAPVRIFQENSAEAFLAGELEGVAVADDGVLMLAPAAEKLAELQEPYAFSLARLPRAWAIGTGNEGRVITIGDDGSTRVLFDGDESEIFALWADPDGTLFVGSSPDGRVYRVSPQGAASPFFDPEETYIWALARGSDGALWVATGAPGRLYRVDASGHAEKAWDGGATHVRSLLALPGGDLLFGTAGDGRVLRWHAGSVRTVYDSDLTEVAALAAGPDGSVWAALLASEASFVDLAPRAGASSGSGGDSSQAVVVVDSAAAAGSRPASSRQPRSQLVRLAADGTSEEVWSSTDETIFSLLSEAGGLWMGTGLDGHLYRVVDDRARVVRDFDERQIVALGEGSTGPVALTTNGAALWRFSRQRELKGTYTSSALDAGEVARFGVFRWRGEAKASGSVQVSFRTGYSSEPDETWSEWTAPRAGAEIALPPETRGRFVQYRLALAGGSGEGPRVVETELSYRQQNLRPTIESFDALDPGQILVPSGFNPAEQTFEPSSPNRDGIFTTLRPTAPREDRMKKVWKQGWLTLRWDASDANDDDLEYRLDVRRQGDRDGAWLEVARDVEETHWAIDATALPDGIYRFRLTASDAPDNADGEALETSLESPPVTIDHAPPELRRLERQGDRLEVTVYDAMSPLRQAEVSVDGAPWRPARPADGLLDGQNEVLMLDGVPKSARFVLLRVIDGSFNVRTFDLGAEASR